jgi:transketolase
MNRNSLIKRMVYLSYVSKEGHLGSSLSILDILYVLYKNFIFNKEDKNECNRFILSKGHASLALYTILNEFNFLSEDINNFCKFNSLLGGHPCDKLPFVEASTGSLGHGLPIAIGIALGYKILNKNERVFVLIGDGEMNEGSIWESLLLAAHHNLNNLTCIMDYNHSGDRALKLDNVCQKISSFNWNCMEINGHDHDIILNSLNHVDTHRPIFIIANTIKGKGISFMENNPEWHHKAPDLDQIQAIHRELDATASGL